MSKFLQISRFSHVLDFRMNKKTIGAMLGAISLIVTLMPSSALAEGYALQDWSGRGAALAGGLVARGGDASAVAYNPAAITELPGTQIMTGFELVAPTNTIEAHTDDGFISTDSENLLFVVPHGFITHKFNDQLSFGFGLFSRFGLGNEYDEDWVGKNNIYSVTLETVTANPVIAWRFNDHLSLAAGVEMMGAKVQLKKRLDFSPAAVPAGDFSLDHEDIEYALGFNLAAHVRFNKEWSAGLTYRSGMDVKFNGEATIAGYPGRSTYEDPGHATMSLPDQISAAVAYAPSEKWSFEAQVGYYTWSKYKSLDMYLDSGTKYSKKDWNDTWLVSLSAEYQALEWLTLRAGISHETSPVPSETAEYMTPTNGRWKYAVGAGFQKNDWTLDVAYIFHDLANAYYNADKEMGTFAGQSTNVYAQSVSVSIGYKF